MTKMKSVIIMPGRLGSTRLPNKLIKKIEGKYIIQRAYEAVKAQTDDLPSGVKRNVELANFEFLMLDSIDRVSPKTGLTVTAEISKDGGAFAACDNSVSEISSGVYKITVTQAEMNASIVTLKFTATGALQRTVTIKTST